MLSVQCLCIIIALPLPFPLQKEKQKNACALQTVLECSLVLFAREMFLSSHNSSCGLCLRVEGCWLQCFTELIKRLLGNMFRPFRSFGTLLFYFFDEKFEFKQSHMKHLSIFFSRQHSAIFIIQLIKKKKHKKNSSRCQMYTFYSTHVFFRPSAKCKYFILYNPFIQVVPFT